MRKLLIVLVLVAILLAAVVPAAFAGRFDSGCRGINTALGTPAGVTVNNADDSACG